MARVIRAGGARVVPVALRDARQKAEHLVREAEARAAALEKRMDELMAMARERARAELAVAHLEVEQARKEALAEAEASIVPLAVAIARRLVGEELALAPERIGGIVQEALARARNVSRVRIRVHPDDAAQLEDRGLKILRDPAIERGGCLVETDRGIVDARLETRIEALAQAITDMLPPKAT